LLKKGISTFEACRILAIKNSLDPKEISFCGLKDTFGITAQLICIPNKGKLKHTKFKNFFITQFKPSNKKLSLRDHLGNRFKVRARNFNFDKQICKEILKTVRGKIEEGLPNFYGPQRFGIRQNNHLYGKLLIKKRYREFIKRFLTDIGEYEPLKIKKIRKEIKENFSDFKKCYKILSKVSTLVYEREMLERLLQKEKIEKIVQENEVLKFCLHSYSSYLFNLTLSSLVAKYKNNLHKLVGFQLQKLGYDSKIDGTTFKLHSEILKKEKINFDELRHAYKKFKIRGHLRNVLFYPKNFSYMIKDKDIFLQFDLGIGEYASLFLEFIFDNRQKPKLE
jgi:TruD family tRNA pseudouridine synthase